ncbi:MAG: hypothetical protein H7268_06155 [Sandarakinorhabdus sp.]|nr:hypothetical protein [Sandarakinorhabdus sp.]
MPLEAAAIEAALLAYADAWRLNSAAALHPHWDAAHFAFYKAEEVTSFYTNFTAVGDYWRQNEGLHDDIRLQLSNFKHIIITSDIRMAAFDMTWDIRFRTDARLATGQDFHHRGKAMGGFNHVLAMLRRTASGWKLTGWSETPDAAITYLTQLYYRTASADFRPD